MNIDNWTYKLPWNTSVKGWSKRALSSVNKIIVHQSMSTGSLLAINNYHISPGNHISEYGCPHICYHFCIDDGGDIYKTNPLSKTTWHCRKQNSSSIGIAMLGHFSGPTFEGQQEPIEEQLNSLEWLLNCFTNKVLNINTKTIIIEKNNIFGHHDFGKTNCPGTVIAEFLSKYKSF